MLRIHFTSADLSRVRLADGPDPLWELALSMHVVQSRGGDPLLSGWRRNVVRLLHPAGRLRSEVSLAVALSPPIGYFPDFLTPIEAGDGFELGLDAVLSTSKARLGREIAALADAQGAIRPDVDDLRRGNRRALENLGAGLRRYFEHALAPLWTRIAAIVDADRAVRAWHFLQGGLGGLLNGLAPSVSFCAGVLEVRHFRRPLDLYLDGRGLLLVPSYFKEDGDVMLLADPALPPVLVFPVHRPTRVSIEAQRTSLTALIGATRTAILEMAATSVTASQAGQRLGITVSAAGRHLTTLANAGLVVRQRDRNMVRHMATPLGRSLISAGR